MNDLRKHNEHSLIEQRTGSDPVQEMDLGAISDEPWFGRGEQASLLAAFEVGHLLNALAWLRWRISIAAWSETPARCEEIGLADPFAQQRGGVERLSEISWSFDASGKLSEAVRDSRRMWEAWLDDESSALRILDDVDAVESVDDATAESIAAVAILRDAFLHCLPPNAGYALRLGLILDRQIRRPAVSRAYAKYEYHAEWEPSPETRFASGDLLGLSKLLNLSPDILKAIELADAALMERETFERIDRLIRNQLRLSAKASQDPEVDEPNSFADADDNMRSKTELPNELTDTGVLGIRVDEMARLVYRDSIRDTVSLATTNTQWAMFRTVLRNSLSPANRGTLDDWYVSYGGGEISAMRQTKLELNCRLRRLGIQVLAWTFHSRPSDASDATT